MARDESPTGSKETRGSGGGGRVVGGSAGAMRGDNGGDLMSRNRSWDEGQAKGFQGCDLAEYKGSASSQKSDAIMQNPSGKGMPKTTDLGPKEFPAPRAPMTGGPRGMGVDGGHGPKTKGSSTGGNVQKGSTGGSDKSPKGSGSTPSGVKGGGFVNGGYGPMSRKTVK